MRFLATLFTLLVFIFGFSAVVLATEKVEPTERDYTYYLGQMGAGEQASGAATTLVVDRDDDPQSLFDCTDSPSDCPLRSALILANQDQRPTQIIFADHYVIRLTRSLPALFEAGTKLYASAGQEVHIDGGGSGSSVLRVLAPQVTIDGLRIYGAGQGYPTLAVSGAAHSVVIAHNIIGDDDAPAGGCGRSAGAYGGVYVDAEGNGSETIRAWIFGNVIECHSGSPGEGITILADRVIVGQDPDGQAGAAERNIVRHNQGFGIHVLRGQNNTLRNNAFQSNVAGSMNVANFNNNIFDNLFS